MTLKPLKDLALEVTSVRYFQTRRGTGYEASTNVSAITIWNDGDGGATYIDWDCPTQYKKYQHLTESELESLIDEYEK
jgi:hypothetical protein